MMTLRTALAALSCASALALGACATSQAGAPVQAQLPPAPGDAGSAYGQFLAGTAAFNDGDQRVAADYFDGAARQEGGPSFLQERAFTAALVAGDVPHAAALAPGLTDSSAPIQRLGRLTQAVDALADGKGKEAYALVSNPPLGEPFASAGVLLAPWAAAVAGDWKTALAPITPRGERLIDQIQLLDQALLLERHHRYDDADAAFRSLLTHADASGVYTTSYGAFLERRGRRADAIALYQAALKGDGANRDAREALDRAQAAKPAPDAPTVNEGAAQALLGPAAVLLAQKQAELGLAYLRLILRLDPTRDEAWVLVGDAMVATGDEVAARDAYNRPQPGSDYFIEARARLITTYDGDDASDRAEALKIAQDTVKGAPGDDDALTLLADSLRVNKQYEDSAKVLDQLIANRGDKTTWQLYFMRGVALQQADHWPEAEADMKRALLLAPNEPEVLNFLGYSWIDRGERLQQAKSMIEKAVAAKPDDGAIVDSLGWAYFRLGDYPKAVAQLEHAAELEAGDPDINNHLGDAYWQVGRRIEARFQWERVLTLDPDPKLRGEVESKLKSGLASKGRFAEAAATVVK